MLEDKLNDMKKINALKPLPMYPDIEKAEDLEELWENVIKDSLPDKNIVVQWHTVLKEYIKQKNVAFCLRAYGSPSGNSPILRRGFLNKVFSDGVELFETFYVDNSFPTYFYAIAKDGYAPKDLDELKSIILNRTIPCGFFHTRAEQELSVYHKGDNPGMSKKGYKLAHIFPAGENYDSAAGYNKISDYCDSIFPRGDRKEWKNVSSIGEYYRPIHINDEAQLEKVRNYAVAHFLRSVHPINYFLVPKKSKRDKATGIMQTNIYWHDSANPGVEKDEIGEYSRLIEYVAAKIKDIYKDTDVYQEFLDLIYPTGSCIDPKEVNVTIDAEYAIGIWQKKIGSTPIHTSTGSKSTPSLKSVSTTRTNRKHPAVDIEFIPNDLNLFEIELLNKKSAKITLIYKDGHTLVDNWDARRYTSNLMKRINDKLWNEPDRDNIVKAVFEV